MNNKFEVGDEVWVWTGGVNECCLLMVSDVLTNGYGESMYKLIGKESALQETYLISREYSIFSTKEEAIQNHKIVEERYIKLGMNEDEE